MTQLTQCPVEQLQAYLDDTLDASLESDLLEHLDQCAACRQRLESAAGSADDWQTARSALTNHEFDADGQLGFESSRSENVAKIKITDPLALLAILSPSDDPRAAGRIGAFEITGIVGSGGMGLVLKARDPALDRHVAVKILAPHLAKSQSARKRFAREARAAAAVIHDNVIAIYQVSEWNELPYLVMPYLPDPSLQQRIDEHGKLDLESTLSIGMQVARGLAAAHSQGLVHRDVKPANVLLAKGTERAIITDFGLARAADDASLTRIGLLAGTPHYMSPEQARGESVDQKSDLFSLGSLLFAMLAGHPPIQHEMGSETIRRISAGELPSLDALDLEIPDWFVELVEWLHQPRPENRPASSQQVADLLEQCLAHHRQPEAHPLPECLLQDNRHVAGHSWYVRLKAAWIPMTATALLAVFVTIPAIMIVDSLVQTVKTDPVTSSDDLPAKTPAEPDDQVGLPAPASRTLPTTALNQNWLGDEAEITALQQEAKAIKGNTDRTWSISPSGTDTTDASAIEGPWGIQPIKTVPGNSDPTSPKESE